MPYQVTQALPGMRRMIRAFSLATGGLGLALVSQHAVATVVPASVPVITASVKGSQSNGWYKTDVSVQWTIKSSTAATSSGCETQTVTADTSATGTTFTCTASNATGSASNSVTIKRDASKPTVTIGAPTSSDGYFVGQQVKASYACNDDISGIASCVGTVENGKLLDTSTSGAKSLTVTATNNAGLITKTRVAYQVNKPLQGDTANYLGLNTWFLTDWDHSFAFVDAMKHARPWQDATDWHSPVGGSDAHGWPTADASTVILTGTPAQINGTYKLVFTGQADVSFMWTNGSLANQVYDAATNTTTADVTFNLSAAGSVGLIMANTKRTATSAPHTGFADMHLYRPGYPADGSAVFTTPFLKALGQVHVVRMMEWMAINQNTLQHWSQRMTPQDMYKTVPTYTGPGGGVWTLSQPGMALEHQIQLCNTLQADCWINIPAAADDDYVRNLALALRYGTDGSNPYTKAQKFPIYPPLNKKLKLYVEYANEIWNSAGGFVSFPVIHDMVSSLPATHPVNLPAESNIWFRMWRYAAYRTAGISDIFRAVYGNASMMSRVRPLLMTQQGNGQDSLNQALIWLDSYASGLNPAREPKSYIYGAGGSAYYGVNHVPSNLDDVDGFFASGNYPATQNFDGMAIDAILAANYGLKRIAYEGGPGLDVYPDAKAQVINADLRMQNMVVTGHKAWSNLGGDLLVYYDLAGPPAWEFTPDISNSDTPKLNGLAQLRANKRAPVTLGQELPGTIVVADQIKWRIRTGSDFLTSYAGLPCIGGNLAGTWIALPGHTAKAFKGRLVLNAQSYIGALVNVWVNGIQQGSLALAASDVNLIDSPALAISVPAGLVVVRLEVVSGGFDLRSIKVAR
jgi:hypothetical protein